MSIQDPIESPSLKENISNCHDDSVTSNETNNESQHVCKDEVKLSIQDIRDIPNLKDTDDILYHKETRNISKTSVCMLSMNHGPLFLDHHQLFKILAFSLNENCGMIKDNMVSLLTQIITNTSFECLTLTQKSDYLRIHLLSYLHNVNVCSISLSETTEEWDRHINTDVSRVSVVETISGKFSDYVPFNQITMDYFWHQQSWDSDRYLPTLFSQVLPKLAENNILRCTDKYNEDGGDILLPFT